MSRTAPSIALRCLLGIAIGVIAAPSQARHGEPPYSLAHPAKAGVDVPIEDVGRIDAAQARRDADRVADASVARTKAQKSAHAIAVSITPDDHGRWDTLDDGSRLWRVRVRAAGATDLRIAFTTLDLPRGATLHLIGADGIYQGPYTRTDAAGAAFHAPVVPGDSATIEVRVPADVPFGAAQLAIGSVGAGFRDLYKREVTVQGVGDSGACNVDVACPLGQPYPNEIRAVGHYEFRAADDGEYYICTGTLVADVPKDKRNYFLTAHHCISLASEAESIVVYWNLQSLQCGSIVAPTQGFYADDQHGAALRATRADVDVTLLELSGTPESDWNLYYAGWDAGGAAVSGTIGIHHPSGDLKKITAGPAVSTMGNCISSTLTSGTHWHAGPYTQGTTEGGSSGSALFGTNGSSSAHRVIGTLSGGSAACSQTSPTQPDDGYDCYGKLSVAWNGSSSAVRLRDWLDPAGTGTATIDGIDQNTSTPVDGSLHSTHAMPAVLLQKPRPVAGASRLRPNR